MEDWFVRAPALRTDMQNDDEIWTFSNGGSWPEFVTNVPFPAGWTMIQGTTVVADDACAVTIGTDATLALPAHWTYQLDLMVAPTTTSSDHESTEATELRIHMVAASALDASTALSSWLVWIKSSHTSWNVTLQAFATQPRQALPPLVPALFHDTTTTGIGTLRLKFVALGASTDDAWRDLLYHIPTLEWVQCTTLDLTDPITSSPYHAPLSCPTLTQWTLSCTLAEFIKFSDCWKSGAMVAAAPPQLSLVLHFMLTAAMLQSLYTCLSRSSSTMTHFSMTYLDITDDAWIQLCRSLAMHSQSTSWHSITLGFTDNFVDAYRRLTPERRALRSRAVLDMVQACPHLCHVQWPACQHDDDVQHEMETLWHNTRISHRSA